MNNIKNKIVVVSVKNDDWSYIGKVIDHDDLGIVLDVTKKVLRMSDYYKPKDTPAKFTYKSEMDMKQILYFAWGVVRRTELFEEEK